MLSHLYLLPLVAVYSVSTMRPCTPPKEESGCFILPCLLEPMINAVSASLCHKTPIKPLLHAVKNCQSYPYALIHNAKLRILTEW